MTNTRAVLSSKYQVIVTMWEFDVVVKKKSPWLRCNYLINPLTPRSDQYIQIILTILIHCQSER